MKKRAYTRNNIKNQPNTIKIVITNKQTKKNTQSRENETQNAK